MLYGENILLEFATFCKNLIWKSAILKTLYGRGFKALVKKQSLCGGECCV